jgi:omega-6 fatty acid desaturase (delta-12 desaturase)
MEALLDVPPVVEVPPSPRARWREIVAPYQRPSTRRSVAQLAVTLAGLFASLAAMHFALRASWLLAVVPCLLASGFLVRTFIVMHDCGHGSFFRSQRANEWVGFATGVLTFTPYVQWAKDHAIHHATSGRLDKRGFGDIGTLTVDEYLALGRLGRLGYRLYRNPAVLLLLGPLWLIATHRVPTRGSAGRREVVSVHATNAAIVLLGAGGAWLVGPAALASVYLPVVYLSAMMGIFMFYVQHQYEHTYWARGGAWDYESAAVSGSSFFALPRALDWMTGSIGFHHVHHLSPRIPNYRLRAAHEENPYFHGAFRLTLGESLRTFSLKLWDERERRMIGWAELRERQRAR